MLLTFRHPILRGLQYCQIFHRIISGVRNLILLVFSIAGIFVTIFSVSGFMLANFFALLSSKHDASGLRLRYHAKHDCRIDLCTPNSSIPFRMFLHATLSIWKAFCKISISGPKAYLRPSVPIRSVTSCVSIDKFVALYRFVFCGGKIWGFDFKFHGQVLLFF